MRRHLLTFGITAAASTVVGIYFATQAVLVPRSVLVPGETWAHALGINLIHYWVWGAAVPLIVHLARRFPLDQTGWRRSVPIHLFIGVALSLITLAIGNFITNTAICPWIHEANHNLLRFIRKNFHSIYPTYWVILLTATVWRAASLQTRLAEARLAALRAQLRPHFLFNTLNSVSSLMYRDVAGADAMIARLSELLRAALRSDQRREISLREEIDLVQSYLDIERVRFDDRLRIDIRIAPDAEDALVPPFLLQPIVENAIRHAIAPSPDGGRLAIAADVELDELIIRVADDGPGLPAAGAEPGVGLSNTRTRLAELYGGAADLELDDADGGGVVVTLTLPWRQA